MPHNPPTRQQFQDRVWEQIRQLRKLHPQNGFGWVVLNATYMCYPAYVNRHVGTASDPSYKSSNRIQQFIIDLEEEVCGAGNIQQEN